MRLLLLLGRILFAATFIVSSLGHFSRATIDYAAHAGVPSASFLVPLSGTLALVGGLMVLFGFHTRLGALLLVFFLVPVTLAMHQFWNVGDPMLRQMQLVNFMKNTALTGAALCIMYFGAGPISLDAWLARREARKTPAGGGPIYTTPSRAS